MLNRRHLLAAAVALTALAPQAHAQDVIKMGGLATLEGPFTVLGEDSMRGLKLALQEANYTAGGK
jgi:branched-chain amino acid transport system substrate-binding protein